MNSGQKYIKQLQLIDRVIKSKTEGLSHADSMVQPPFPGNCMNWNLGHILTSRDFVMGNIDGRTEQDPREKELYGWGSEPLTDSDMAVPLDTLLEKLDNASQKLSETLGTMDDNDLGRVINEERGTTLADRLDFMLMFHESYHAGMLELLYELALAERE